MSSVLNSVVEFFLPSSLPKIKQRYHFIATIHATSSLIIHIILFAVFSKYEVPYLVEFNVFSILFFIYCLNLIQKGRYATSLLISSIEILIHNSFGVHMLGLATGMHFLILVNIVSTPLYCTGKFQLKMLISAVSTFSVIALVTIYYHVDPVFALPSHVLYWIFVSNVSFAMIGLGFGVMYNEFSLEQTEDELVIANRESERLLDNILPPSISIELKRNPGALVQRFEQATILFADIVNFTPLSETMTPQDLVEMLNDLFSRFDDLTVEHGLEKIKTIGDAYMVAAGVPNEISNHALRSLEFAKAMLEVVDEFNLEKGRQLQMRIGMSSGPLVAGVIGKTKFIYDLWGDTVNTAARMESFGIQGRIQLSEQCYSLINDEYSFECRNNVEIKGKGLVSTYVLVNDNPTP